MNVILCIASFVFYATYDYKYLIYLVISIVLTYVAGLVCDSFRTKNKALSKSVFIVTLVINIAMLCYFKYTNFMLGSINDLFNLKKRQKE